MAETATTRMAQPAPPDTTHAGGNLRWVICALLFYATSINYMDRQVLSILSVTLQHSIGWTEVQYSYIVDAFQGAYALGLLVVGRLVDRLGSRTSYALIMAAWSLAAMSHALARTVFTFGIARFFLGLGESGNFPAALKTTAEWFPRKERSLATGIFNSGTSVGAILAPALVPVIAVRLGWPYAFLATGVFSSLWLVLWLSFYRKPADHPRIRPSELAYIQSDPVESVKPIPWIRLLGFRQTYCFPLAKFLTDPIWWFYLFWLPKFLDARYHVDLLHLWLPLILIYNASTIGSIGGGWLPGWLHRHRGVPLGRARYFTMLLCACAVVPMIFANRLPNLWAAVALLSLAVAAHQGWSANLLTVPSDLFPRQAVASVVGIGGMAGSVGAVFFSTATGWILQITRSYTSLFVIAGTAYMAALIIMKLIVPQLKPIPAERLEA